MSVKDTQLASIPIQTIQQMQQLCGLWRSLCRFLDRFLELAQPATARCHEDHIELRIAVL
jgi:hypothetical protein